jgi:hypothetical protein
MAAFATTTSVGEACRDKWVAALPLATVLGGCGFARYNQVTKNGSLYERYIGSVDYAFYEKIVVGSGGEDYEQQMWRTSSASIPVVLDLLYARQGCLPVCMHQQCW